MNITRSKNELQGRILAIDYGERRIGLAISDPLFITAQGLDTLDRKRKANPVTAILHIVREFEVRLVIIGMPLTMKGRKEDTAERVEQFAAELRQAIDIPIEYVDERLTSAAAKRALIEMGYKTGHRKELVDRVSAVFILQTYLDSLRPE